MELDVVIDVVCPWCFVGKRQLDRALEMRPGVVTAVRWHPYQLAPDAPVEGVDRTTYYENKFGNSPQFQAAREHLKSLGPTLGIKWDFESPCLIANTLDAHRVIRWASSPGVQAEVVDALMRRYFEDCQFLGDPDVLVSAAEEAGMDGALVRELLASDADKDTVRAEVTQAQAMGIQGVPMFIFNRQSAVSGAQEADVLAGVIDKLAAA
ncbi:DsbA family oxidoreductase [Kordiimonas marina]|uniref:DsbA family oxidoreductase n=1 Tax=Kordiimonas marina TaxID=2872312 RepID=UPI001FF6C8AC|nr:DsbA family oxidoreductase [Kordiimonas marina]MCJ9430181.1 DsbA family oxidoreductase [Kordiimonas marina]